MCLCLLWWWTRPDWPETRRSSDQTGRRPRPPAESTQTQTFKECWAPLFVLEQSRRGAPESQRPAPPRVRRLPWPSSSPQSPHRSPTLNKDRKWRLEAQEGGDCRCTTFWLYGEREGALTHWVMWPRRTEARPSPRARLQRDAVSSEGAPSPRLHTHTHSVKQLAALYWLKPGYYTSNSSAYWREAEIRGINWVETHLIRCCDG